MKRNLISVIILALSVINFVLLLVIVFAIVPSAKKTDNLVTQIASVIKLDLNDKGEKEEQKVSQKDIYSYSFDDNLTVSMDDASGTQHYAVVKLAVNLNMTSDDYKLYSVDAANGIKTKKDVIFDAVREVLRNYTYEEAKSNQAELEKQCNDAVKDVFNTDAFYSVSFSQFLFQ